MGWLELAGSDDYLLAEVVRYSEKRTCPRHSYGLPAISPGGD